MEKKILIMNSIDNVAVLLEDSSPGDTCQYNDETLKILENVPFGHKVALKDLESGENVYKYGEKIGYALESIAKGQWIHNHNMGCHRGK